MRVFALILVDKIDIKRNFNLVLGLFFHFQSLQDQLD